MAARTPSTRGAVALNEPRITPTPPVPTDSGNGGGQTSLVTATRRYNQLQTRYSIAKLTAATLVSEIRNFKAGYLTPFAQRMEEIEERDDVLKSVIPKREASVKRLKWQVLVNEDVEEGEKEAADEHRKALFDFYNTMAVTHAMDANLKGGFSSFVEFAMKCVGHRWSAFEMIWKPTTEGLAAEAVFVPLRFFENRTGQLRFLASDFATFGDELNENGWVVFCGPGLLEPCAVNYLIKDLARTSWLIYCQNQGMPGIVGKTTAGYQSAQWTAFNTALGDLLAGNTLLMGEGDSVEKLDLSAQGTLPFPELIREQNERMATLWRGGSKSTISTGGPDQTGVTLQADEETKLAADDGQRLSDTLNQTLDKIVIEWTFGEGVKPLAYVKIAPPQTIDADRDIKVFTFLGESGVTLGKQQLREHFSVGEPAEGDEPVTVPKPKPAFGQPQLDADGNPLMDTGALDEGAQDEATPEELQKELNAKRAELRGQAGNEKLTQVDLLKSLNTPRNARALNELLRSGQLNELANTKP
jgi:phage gp29-like protein